MAASLAKGVLRAIFGSDTKHWAIAKERMEQSFGEIKIEPIAGGKVRAFFAEQTLVGDQTCVKKFKYKHTLTSLDMREAIGTGKSMQEAIVGLWNTLTELGPYENILQFIELRSHQPFSANYKDFIFENGQFKDRGVVVRDQPPARPDHIEKFLADEKMCAFIGRCEDQVFGTAPNPAKA